MSEAEETGRNPAGDRPGLRDEVKTFIVQALACFDTPSEVAKAVEQEFGLSVSRQAVEAYDPAKRAGRALSAKFRAIFQATRATFLEETAAIGVSHRAVRLRMIERLAHKAEAMGNLVLAASLLEQAAKEVGNAFTNKREVAGDAAAAPVRMVVSWRKPQ